MSECCGGKNRIIYACSGASNVGEISDHIARKLRDENYGKMSCLSGVGADLSGYIETARGSDESVVIDGCPARCGRKIFEKHGIPARFLVLSDFGLEKGKTPVTEDVVEQMIDKIKNGIRAEHIQGE
jgi:uncharacterized metal-binding protein